MLERTCNWKAAFWSVIDFLHNKYKIMLFTITRICPHSCPPSFPPTTCTVAKVGFDTLVWFFRNFGLPRPEQVRRTLFSPAVGQTRNDDSAVKTGINIDQGGGATIWQTTYKSSRRCRNFAKCTNTFASDCSNLLTHVGLRTYQELYDFTSCINNAQLSTIKIEKMVTSAVQPINFAIMACWKLWDTSVL